MTHSIPTETRDVKSAEILHTDAAGARIVRLDGYYSSPFGHCGGIQETFAELGEGGVTLVHTSSLKKPKSFSMDAETVDTFCQAWQEFRAARKAMHEQEQRDYYERIQDLMQKASDLGGELVMDEDGNFELIWPRIHPMYGLYRIDRCLSLGTVEERLTNVKEIQEGACGPARDLKILDIVAAAFDAEITLDGRQRDFCHEHDASSTITTYSLIFAPDSLFHGFWTKVTGLTLAQVDYRLRYVEGIKTR